MDRMINGIIKHRRWVIAVFIAVSLASAVSALYVDVNYDMTDYLPEQAQSTAALKIMEEEFDQPMPNASVMVRNVTLMEAAEYKKKIAAIDGVAAVLWLDDVADITQPLETLDASTVEAYYKDGAALYSVAVEKGKENAAVGALLKEGNAVSGEAADNYEMQRSTGREVFKAMLVLVPIIIVILTLSTASWIDPLLFLAAIGVSVLINMGSNLLFGEISFMTNSITPILQLAVSLDYAIFLLNSFAEARKQYGDAETAMKHAIRASIKTVSASALTTLFGFLALIFMNFRIGADLGLSLAKGIVLSFLSVTVFLPALTLGLVKLLDKTRHRPLMPGFQGAGRVLTKLAVPAVVFVALAIVPSYLGQGHAGFFYGNGDANASTRNGADKIAIEETFGEDTVMAVLVPRGDVAKERALGRELGRLEQVNSVVSYASMVGAEIPPEVLGEGVTGQFYSDHYARLVVYLDTPQEGDRAFAAVEAVQRITQGYYGDGAYFVGQSANLYDIRNVVRADNTRVNILAIAAIFLVLLLTFKSGVLPVILLLTIETAIWVNMAIPYFSGATVSYIGYLVISTVQLGATVDYAILLTDHYMKERRALPKREAIRRSIGASFKSILVSGTTLAAAGFTLHLTSSDSRVSDIGLLLGRGTLISMAMVLCFLPAMLTLLDRAIGALTLHAEFYRPEASGQTKQGGRT